MSYTINIHFLDQNKYQNYKIWKKYIFEINLCYKKGWFITEAEWANITQRCTASRNGCYRFLNNLFETEGDYRQHLTQSEDYVLQAAISILSAQQTIISELTKVASKPRAKSTTVNRDDEIKVGLRKKQIPITIGGSAIGSAAGAIALGTWGCCFWCNSRNCNCYLLYCTAKSNKNRNKGNNRKAYYSKREHY